MKKKTDSSRPRILRWRYVVRGGVNPVSHFSPSPQFQYHPSYQQLTHHPYPSFWALLVVGMRFLLGFDRTFLPLLRTLNRRLVIDRHIQLVIQMTNSYNMIIVLAVMMLVPSIGQNIPQVQANIDTTFFQVTILPTTSYKDINGSALTQASPQACYADCQSCQIQTNQCQQCYSPYYLRLSNSICQLNPGYILQSSSNQVKSGGAFILAAQSWTNSRVTDCTNLRTGNFFLNQMIAIQPLDPNTPLRYDRTLSLHNYIVVRFLLVTSGWGQGSSMLINILNQAGRRIISQTSLPFRSNVPMESLCSPNVVDQRYSVTVRVQDSNSTALGVSLQGVNGQISVVTWAIITGQCHTSCSSCSYSSQPTACLGCNYFLKQISDGSCSQCPPGFKLVTSDSLTYCQKCPIQYQECTVGAQLCYYSHLNATAAGNCFVQTGNSYYSQVFELNSEVFAGSLWTVNGLPSPSQYIPCGQGPSSHTYIGPAGPFQPVSRIFANSQQHLSFSLSFNVFAVDVGYSLSRNSKFQIYLNNKLYDIKYLLIPAISDVCSSSAPEAFVTFPPTTFYTDSSTNLNLTIVADTFWGLRNVRIVYQKCDSNCMNCGPNGCLQCFGLLQLKNGRCSGCPQGYGVNSSASINSNYYCFKCTDNCLDCSIVNVPVNSNSSTNSTTNNPNSTCLLCSAPFFLYKGGCQLRTNIGTPLLAPPLILQPNTAAPIASCSLPRFTPGPPNPSTDSSPTSPDFTLSSSTLTSTLENISQQFYKSIVQFYLVRVGQWQPTDRLDIYINDLLIASKSYSPFGNQLCTQSPGGSAGATDFLSFQSIEFFSSNKTLTVYFQLVSTTNTGSTAVFGVNNLKMYPVGCSACLTYPFTYQISYNYDQALNVVVAFSRTYRESDPSLFKQIFILKVNSAPLSYSILSNNSVVYFLRAFLPQQVINGTITLQCRFPELVKTDVNDTVNTPQPFFPRLLIPTYNSSKIVDNTRSSIILTRFSPVNDQSAINGVRTFFQIMSRIVIYGGFIMFLVGLQTITTHLMHNFQKVWLHIYLGALTAPALLRQVLTGFSQVQNQNIAIRPSQWQNPLPLQLYYSTDTYLYQYHTDVNFFRNIYNIGVVFGGLMAYLLLMYLITKYCITKQDTQASDIKRHFKVTFHRRPYFYFNSLIFYQFLTLVFACTLQFTDATTATQQGAFFGGASMVAAVVAFIFATIYPLFHLFWMRKKKQDVALPVKYCNRYHQIFFRFVSRKIWNGGQISYAQQFYNVYRFGELWWYGVVITTLTYSPVAQLFLLLITQALHMFVVLFSELNRNFFYMIIKVLELAMFVGLQIILLVCQTQKDTLTNQSYNTLGGVSIGLIFLLVALSLIRTAYNALILYQQYQYQYKGGKNQGDKNQSNQKKYVRQDRYYGSDDEQSQGNADFIIDDAKGQ